MCMHMSHVYMHTSELSDLKCLISTCTFLPIICQSQQKHACVFLSFHSLFSHVTLTNMFFSFPREILAEIKRLRVEHDAACQASPEKGSTNPTLLAELRLLR